MDTNSIKKQIAIGNLKEAINEVLKTSKKDNLHMLNSIIILKSNFQELINKEHKGILTQEESVIQRNQIKSKLIEIVDSYEDKNEPNLKRWLLKFNYIKYILIILAMLFVILILFFGKIEKNVGIEGNNNDNNKIEISND